MFWGAGLAHFGDSRDLEDGDPAPGVPGDLDAVLTDVDTCIVATDMLLSGPILESLQDLMDTLTTYSEAVGYPLESPASLPQLDDARVVSPIDLCVRTGMFEERSTPAVPAISCLPSHKNETDWIQGHGCLGKGDPRACRKCCGLGKNEGLRWAQTY